ncbi:hypothetical protein A7P95_04900 [Eikenella longinqua]|uniref:Surface-adhesin protein E-like domain-containing protein n=1 Tax=Eikenella longinqua TaxID=1795827 RepID=A0A1A9RXT8_9NEIS|nr:surface-adhesin E family protein [Eikenella longinqua]OAM29075.1 hypothetical protein A7P95_04900 [Eikenella longinqua]
MKKVLLGVLLVLAGMTANAERMDDRWVLIGNTTEGGGVIYYDSQTITNNTVWFKIRYTSRNLPHIRTGQKFNESIAQFAISCPTRQMAEVSRVFYLRGRTIASGSSQYLKYDPITPDTIGEIAYRVVCQETERQYF